MNTATETPRPPETLTEAVIYFADESRAHDFVASLRWPNGQQVCPHCGVVAAHYRIASRRIWKCRDCRKQFSVKVGTIFEDSPLPLSKWLPAMWMLANCKNGVSSYEVARALKVTQKTAWFMLHRLRLALQPDGGGRMEGTIEVDETFIGGLARNMHKARRARVIRGHGGSHGKTSVLGVLMRGAKEPSRVVCRVVGRPGNPARAEHANAIMAQAGVAEGAKVNTDSAMSFAHFSEKYNHGVIDHLAREYVRGTVHTNGIENFWSLFKRTVRGTYVCPAPAHVFRYLDEQAFRFNERTQDDAGRLVQGVKGVTAKRLTYAALTGKGLDRRTA